jgi:hypothetical protein
MNGRIALNVSVSCAGDGALKLVVLLAHPHGSIRIEPATISAMIWAENDDIIRISLQHHRSRALAYAQGNRALRNLCACLGLSVADDTSEHAL